MGYFGDFWGFGFSVTLLRFLGDFGWILAYFVVLWGYFGFFGVLRVWVLCVSLGLMRWVLTTVVCLIVVCCCVCDFVFVICGFVLISVVVWVFRDFGLGLDCLW